MMPAAGSATDTESDRTEHPVTLADQTHLETRLLGVSLEHNAHSIEDSVRVGFALRTSVVIGLLMTPPALWVVFNIEQLVELFVKWQP